MEGRKQQVDSAGWLIQAGASAQSLVSATKVMTTRYTRDPPGRLLAEHPPLGDRHFLGDAIGSVKAQADPATGQLVARCRYDRSVGRWRRRGRRLR